MISYYSILTQPRSTKTFVFFWSFEVYAVSVLNMNEQCYYLRLKKKTIEWILRISVYHFSWIIISWMVSPFVRSNDFGNRLTYLHLSKISLKMHIPLYFRIFLIVISCNQMIKTDKKKIHASRYLLYILHKAIYNSSLILQTQSICNHYDYLLKTDPCVTTSNYFFTDS